MHRPVPRVRSFSIPPLLVLAAIAAGCRATDPPAPPMATPSLTFSRTTVPLGNPVDMTYKFVVAKGATFTQDYHVMVHFADQDDMVMYTDDHDPPVPTSMWKPGQTIEYTRTFFAPVYPYEGDATVSIGLYAPGAKLRVPMAGVDTGHRAYIVGKIRLVSPNEGVTAVYKDGWYQVEGATANGTGWHWTRKEATLAVRNPKADSVFYLDADNPDSAFTDTQHVTVSLASGPPIDEFTLTPPQRVLRKVPIAASAWGGDENVELRIDVDKTFVPSRLAPTSHDSRDLGIRVFHAVVVAGK